MSVSSIVTGYVELSQPATTRDIKALIKGSSLESTHEALGKLVADHAEQVMSKRLSVLDILEVYPDIEISFSVRVLFDILPTTTLNAYHRLISQCYRLCVFASTLSRPRHCGTLDVQR